MGVPLRFWPFIVTFVFFVYSATGLPATSADCDPDDFSRLLEYVPDATAIKKEYLHYFKFPSDNLAFHRLAAAHAKTDKVLYFHVENAVLKLLNDKVLGDKQVSAALSNLHKRLLFEAIMADPVLKAQLIPADQGGMYSDYKSVRLAFHSPDRATGEKLNEALNRAYEQVSKKFGSEIARYPTLKALYEGRADLSGNPSHWNLAGVGANPEQASLAARQARFATRLYTGDPHPIVAIQAYGRVMEKMVKEDVMFADEIRQNVIHLLGLQAERVFDPEGIMRVEAVGILRKAESDPTISGKQAYLDTIREKFRDRFGITLTDQTIEYMQRYFHRVNKYAPSIYADESETMHLAPMEGATHGVWTFDLRGAGDDNLRGAMMAMKETSDAMEISSKEMSSKQVADIALAKLRRNQDAISAEFINVREIIPQTLASMGALHQHDRLTKTGDETVWLPDHDISSADSAKVLSEIQKRMPPGKGIRVTVQPQNYDKSTFPLDPASRFDWSAKMESYEKNLREYLGKQMPDLLRSGDLDRIEMTMVLRPHGPASGDLNIWFSLSNGHEIVPRLRHVLLLHAQNFSKRDQTQLAFPEFDLSRISTFTDVINSGTRPLYVPGPSPSPRRLEQR